MKSKRKKLVAKADRIFSEYIRKRDNYTCFICGRIGYEKDGVMQCGHLITRADYSVRWFELNANCSCSGCNLRHEYDWSVYFNKFIAMNGKAAWEEIRQKRICTKKLTDSDIEEIIEYYSDKIYKKLCGIDNENTCGL